MLCLGTLGGVVNPRVGVVDAHSVCARMLLHDFHHCVIRFFARPVALPLKQDLLPCDRDGAGLDGLSDEHRELIDELLFRRADEQGDARGSFNLGVVLHQRGDVVNAAAAYRRAEQRGDPDAAFNLGVLLYEAGDLDGAEASWRRSARSGNPRATENLEFAVQRRREQETAGIGHGRGER